MSTGDPLADRERSEVDSATREGHSKALADLYRQHRDQWLRVLSARTGSREAAKEVLHEAYAKMLELDRPETASFLKAYIWKIAENLASNRRKQEATRARLNPVATLGPERFAPSAEELVNEEQLLRLLEEAIDKLPKDWFESFVLRVQHGLPFKEVGKRMGITERTAQLHVARALEYCQSQLDTARAAWRKPK